MQNINASDLANVVGGTSSNDQITQQLTSLSTSLQSLGSNNNNNNSSSSSSMMMMAMMMAMKPHDTVVAGGGAPMVAAPAPVAAPGPVVNISTRVRH